MYNHWHSKTKKTVIWGTTIVVDEVIEKLRKFFFTFTTESEKKKNEKKKGRKVKEKTTGFYVPLLAQIRETQDYTLNIDAEHFMIYDKKLYQDIILYPQEMITLIDVTINEVFKEIVQSADANVAEDELNSSRIQIRLFNLNEYEDDNIQIKIPSKSGLYFPANFSIHI